LGLGGLYVASGRNLAVSIAARAAFACTAVALEAFRVI